MTRSFFTKAAAAAVAVTFAASAQAQTTTQNYVVNFNGSVLLQNQPGNANNLLLDFLTGSSDPTVGGSGTTAGNIFIVPTTNLPGVAPVPGAVGTIQDLVFNQTGAVGTQGGSGVPIASFVTLGGYTFSVTSFSTSSNTPPGGFGPITITGDAATGSTASFGVVGRVTGGIFGSAGAAYTGRFSSDFSGQSPADVFNTINSGGSIANSFAGRFTITATNVVPEPSTYALMASGVAMLGAFARRRRQA